MRTTNEERHLLARLAGGELDGTVGDVPEKSARCKVFFGKYIKNGIPVSYREGELTRLFHKGERLASSREEKLFDTDELKLIFLQHFGCLMEDAEVRAYSAKHRHRQTG